MSQNKILMKGSNVLKTIIASSIIVLVFAIASSLYIQRNADELSVLINQSGMIRGGIQRIIKLRLFQENVTNEERIVDIRFDNLGKYILSKKDIFTADDYLDYIELRTSWDKIKTIKNDELYEKSEEIWFDANNIVNNFEMKTRRLIKLDYIFSYFVLFSIFLLLLLFYLVNVIVRNNLEKKASIDPLTKLLNRNYLQKIYDHKMEENESDHLAILLGDIDYFKKINDNYGHNVGDDVLKKVAVLLGSNVRKNDFVFRYGGEEFLLIVTFSEVCQLMEYAERLRKAVETTEIDNIKITISFGVSFAKKGQSIDKVLLSADTALYKAKSFGRNCVVLSDADLDLTPHEKAFAGLLTSNEMDLKGKSSNSKLTDESR
ncbi:MAG TPA: GGDEF domain-containing protein [Candidatus Competibacteraceae bacterium]|mgnify:CR=1 FL=1|nr:GGDEF domain-containing protein [Candidatus Competibacteraceae bacterium]HQD55400.1 GGDEF domain-containing protein [Candidatus Competibacteraceae bacterium]